MLTYFQKVKILITSNNNLLFLLPYIVYQIWTQTSQVMSVHVSIFGIL